MEEIYRLTEASVKIGNIDTLTGLQFKMASQVVQFEAVMQWTGVVSLLNNRQGLKCLRRCQFGVIDALSVLCNGWELWTKLSKSNSVHFSGWRERNVVVSNMG